MPVDLARPGLAVSLRVRGIDLVDFFDSNAVAPPGGLPWDPDGADDGDLVDDPFDPRERPEDLDSPDLDEGDYVDGPVDDADWQTPYYAHMDVSPVVRNEGAEAIARYRPWHLYGPRWGIVFSERPFWSFVGWLAEEVGSKTGTAQIDAARAIAPIVWRVVRTHEEYHFRVEVLATGYEAVERRSLYPAYLLERFCARSPWTRGAVEELLATQAEVAEVTKTRDRHLRGAYLSAVEMAPAGYRDWRQAARTAGPQAPLPEMFLRSSIRGAPSYEATEPRLTAADKRAVPERWVGGPLPGFLRKSTSPVNRRPLETWLRSHGFDVRSARGRGGHAMFFGHRVKCAYAWNKHGELSPGVARTVAHRLGFANADALVRAIDDGTPPPIATAVAV